MQTIVSFDFDETLADYAVIGWGERVLVAMPKMVELLNEYHALGCECIVLTARSPLEEHVEEIEAFLKRMDLYDKVAALIFTSHQPKGPFAEAYGVQLHYDDDQNHLASVRSHGIQAVDSELVWKSDLKAT